MAPARLAINGYGRIGQCVLRALYECGYRDRLQVVALNEPADQETVAYLTRYDTTHGRFHGEVAVADQALHVNGDRIALLREPDLNRLQWPEVDLVLECTGSFTQREKALKHVAAGAQKVLFSQPAQSTVDATVVWGVNQTALRAEHQVVSAASCTTNCIIPVIKTLDDAFGIEHGMINTIHSAMNDQPAIDAYHHSDLRRTRSAMQSIIPVDTALAKGVGRVLPHLRQAFQARAVRVPTINVSAMDLCVQLQQTVTVSDVNHLLRERFSEDFNGVMGYTEEPNASCDFNHDARSGIVDGTQTAVSGKRLLKVFTWFDNEWGFANRMLDVADYWLNQTQSS